MNQSSAPQVGRPLYFQSDGKAIFALQGEPNSGQNLREGVILCAPAPYEIKKYHWTLRQMALRLQQAGYTTLRFDYLGSGDSEGASTEYDLESCQKNIQDAIVYLKSSGLVRRITLVATRIAAPLAMLVLRSERVKRLVLIDPLLDGPAHLERVNEMHRQLLQKQNFEVLRDAGTQAQALGFPLDALLRWQLTQLTGEIPLLKVKSINLLQSKGSPDLQQLAAKLLNQVDEVQLRSVNDHLKWDQLEGLQMQDFPNELIASVVEAVRGQA